MVGSHLADYLLDQTDWNIFGFCRWNDNFENIQHLLPRINTKDRIELIYGDLNDFPTLMNAVQEATPDYVFHLAAQSYPQTIFKAPLETLDTNILGTAKLLEAINKSPYKPVIHVCASSEVFGRVPKEFLPIDEEVTFHPASPYAISKVGTDLIGRYYAEAYGLIVMTTRMFDHLAPSTFSNDLFLDGGVFEVAVLQGQTDEQVCDLMFTTFGNNAGGNKPEGYAGRSMSVGDVVIVNLTAYACKDFGWEVITDKLSNSNIA